MGCAQVMKHTLAALKQGGRAAERDFPKRPGSHLPPVRCLPRHCSGAGLSAGTARICTDSVRARHSSSQHRQCPAEAASDAEWLTVAGAAGEPGPGHGQDHLRGEAVIAAAAR